MYMCIVLKINIGGCETHEESIHPVTTWTFKRVFKIILKKINNVCKKHKLQTVTYDTLIDCLGMKIFEDDEVGNIRETMPITTYKNIFHFLLLLWKSVCYGKKIHAWTIPIDL